MTRILLICAAALGFAYWLEPGRVDTGGNVLPILADPAPRYDAGRNGGAGGAGGPATGTVSVTVPTCYASGLTTAATSSTICTMGTGGSGYVTTVAR